MEVGEQPLRLRSGRGSYVTTVVGNLQDREEAVQLEDLRHHTLQTTVACIKGSFREAPLQPDRLRQ